jgi:protein gp37
MAHNVAVCQYYEGLTDRDGQWTGRVNLFPGQMEQALRWRRPRRIFLGSMTDLFHEAVPDEFLDQIFACVALAPRHTFLVLTKRPKRMRRYFTRFTWQHHTQVLGRAAMSMFGEDAANAAGNALDGVLAEGRNVGWPMRNLWLGVTAEDQQRADERIPILLKTPASIHFVSVEPMLGPLNITKYLGCSWACPECGAIEQHEECHREDDYSYNRCLSCGYTNDNYEPWGSVDELEWIIAGGETGPGARPMHLEWVRSLREQCQRARVPFFLKQMGEYAPCPAGKCKEVDPACKILNEEFGSSMCRVGKRIAGRMLDGVEWNEFPEV